MFYCCTAKGKHQKKVQEVDRYTQECGTTTRIYQNGRESLHLCSQMGLGLTGTAGLSQPVSGLFLPLLDPLQFSPGTGKRPTVVGAEETTDEAVRSLNDSSSLLQGTEQRRAAWSTD
ncbi:uncharacterized protein V6R79_010751 [Siganus canaliculatus]